MKHLIQGKLDYQCTTYSTAMILGITHEEVLELLGHDGRDIVNESGVGSAKYRGVHIQEIQNICCGMGKALIPYEPIPNLAGAPIECWGTYIQREIMPGSVGLILGHNRSGRHCVAWDGNKILDPNGLESSLTGIECFYKLVDLNACN